MSECSGPNCQHPLHFGPDGKRINERTIYDRVAELAAIEKEMQQPKFASNGDLFDKNSSFQRKLSGLGMPGDIITARDGTQYVVHRDGSWRRVKP